MASGEERVTQLGTLAGIQRDGTTLDQNFYTDGQWVRFQRGRPKKIGGFQRITDSLTGPIQKVLVWSRQSMNELISFSGTKIEQVLVDSNGIGNAITDRTGGFTAQPSPIWSADTQYDEAVGSTATVIVAHQSNSGTNIDDGTAVKPCWALANGNTAFAQIVDAPAVSGGVFCIPPYTIAYGSDGQIAWSDANQPQTWSTSATPGDAGADRITGAKIVQGLPFRAGTGIAGLLWSLDSLLRMDYTGGSAIWRFSTLSTQSSILAQNSVIEYDGVYFWIGIDRFLYFDTALRELPNNFNQNWFFDNLNYDYRQKVWVTKVPRYGEIWWFYPSGTSTICNRAVIFNVREKCWYDVELGRSAGYYSQFLHYPIWANSSTEGSGSYGLYLHEKGRDSVIGNDQTAIKSYFTTADFGYPTGGGASQQSLEGLNRWTRLTRVEPDFIQEGNMTVTVSGKEFAQGDDTTPQTLTFTPTTGKVDMRSQFREILLTFESNEVGGFYEAGKILVHTEPGDIRS